MVTHDQTEALAMADRIVVMQDGKVSQNGSPAELYDHPENPYVARFIGTSNFIPGVVERNDAERTVVNFGQQEINIETNNTKYLHGDRVSICVRPERARLVSKNMTPEPGLNALPATVDEILYHGSSARVRVHLSDNTPFLVDVQLQSKVHRDSLPAYDESVTVVIPDSNALIFTRQSDE